MIDFVAAESAARGRVSGIMAEIKHGTYFSGLGLPMEDVLLAALAAHAYTRTAPAVIQSFEIGNLKYLRGRLAAGHYPNIRLLQLLDDDDRQPYDMVVAGSKLGYAQMMTAAGLRDIAAYADVIAPNLRT